ncbi:hypothetical protein GIY23_21595 [Allosaccharopolyspora coralli]|uniref:Bacterial SCP orthologue domain-containing protein n=1 Tax=Allosaccharopolyspora coralli TaxID=2665642 RepID=A0A5Q3QEU6_9PSEU|nr:sterol carrier family protein [Allosaccharopolyspora coralli]QGK71764.1 hypothetical protein GIY23_21595 [Allosaccharopolyspora coralli]
MAKRGVEASELRRAVQHVAPWLDGGEEPPPRTELAKAVRLSLRTLEQLAPGRSVEVRVPPYAAVQCVEGPRHTRGTPPNVIETDARTWLRMATGALSFAEAVADGSVTASGARADLDGWLPLVRIDSTQGSADSA